MSSAHDCELSTYLRIGKGLCTLRLITVESIPNFLIQQFLLDFAEVYNFKAKCLMEFLSFRISVSECHLSIRVYQSCPPMSLSAKFWATFRRWMFDFEMKARAGRRANVYLYNVNFVLKKEPNAIEVSFLSSTSVSCSSLFRSASLWSKMTSR